MSGPEVQDGAQQPDADQPHSSPHAGKEAFGAPGKRPCPVVGIGASAGGLEPFKRFLSALPTDSGLAYVFVQHLAPMHKSILAELLKPVSRIPVQEVGDGELAIKPDHVYLLAPSYTVTIQDGVLRPHTFEAETRRSPINVFLMSLAADRGPDSACIILSGAGTDGTAGLRAIKEAGGLTLAQSLETAEHDSMLRSAIDTGLVDFELPVEEMPGRLVDYFRHGIRLQQLERRGCDNTPEPHLPEICKLLKKRTGHDFQDYKQKTLVRRVQRRMQILQEAKYAAYVDRLKGDGAEQDRLFMDLLIGVTHFFRDPEAFEALDAKVIAPMVEGKTGQDTLRLWVPGCATGEEAYSIAMLVMEHLSKLDDPPKLQIFATDIDEAALQVARTGFFPLSIDQNVPRERLDRFFIAEAGGYRVRGAIREVCLFSVHNLLRDPPFSRMHLISCRNVLIYMNADLQNRLIPVLHYALQKDGALFLGPAENVSQNANLFQTLDKKHRLFRRREDGVRSLPRFPVNDADNASPGAAHLTTKAGRPGRNLGEHAEKIVIERYAPAYVVINESLEIVESSRGTGKFLELTPGPPDLNILSMARPDLRLHLRAAIHRAIESRQKVVHTDLTIGSEQGMEAFTLAVDPLPRREDGNYFLIVFQPAELPALGDRGDASGVETLVTQQLERELRATKERLQATTEELETSNEELKSSNEELLSLNEELQSANEELETSKEELQSVNEELQTVNSELNQRVEELSRANSDLKNLLENTQIATVFLDRHLAIKSYTPPVRELFYLRDSDLGRPILEITNRLDDDEFEADIRTVLKTDQTMEREVSAAGGALSFIMRIHPYRTADNENDGAVLTFTNISERKQAEKHQDVLLAELSHRVKNTLAAVQAIAKQTLQQTTSLAEFEESFSGRLGALGTAHSLLTKSNWQGIGLSQLIGEILAPYSASETVSVDCPPDIVLDSKVSVTLALALHELATNAGKYGALSVKAGKVAVYAGFRPASPGRELFLTWAESDGPPVTPPKRHGFGLTTIDQSVRYDLKGAADFEFLPAGFRCTIHLPMPTR